MATLNPNNPPPIPPDPPIARTCFRCANPISRGRKCKACSQRDYKAKFPDRVRANERRWRRRNPLAMRAKRVKSDARCGERIRRHNLRRNYGMTTEAYDAMLDSQNYACACCGGANKDGRRLAVDHCHGNGHIRGLLCSSCNAGIGMFRNDASILVKAIEYLNKTERRDSTHG